MANRSSFVIREHEFPRADASVCVAGMHRSGTSMVARILNICGLDLGPEGSIVAPAADNPDGFWEHRAFQEINEGILEELGGAWDRPPRLPADLERTTGDSDYAGRARAIASEMTRPWGWKDPRDSLLLPFWKQIYPALKVIVCIRGPLDVVVSLRIRNGFSHESALALWYEYNRSLLEATTSGNRLVVHFDDFFSRPRRAVERLVDFAGLNPSEEVMASAVESIHPERRHSSLPVYTLIESEVHPAIRAMYSALCAEAETVIVPDDSGSFPPWPEKLHGRLLNRTVVEARILERELGQVKEALDHYRSALSERDRELEVLRAELSAAGSETDAREREVETLRLTARSQEQELAASRFRIGDLETELEDLRTGAADRERTLVVARSEIAELSSRLEEVRAEAVAQQTRHAALQRETKSLTLALSSAQDAIAESDGVRAERDRLQERLQSLSAELATTSAQLQTLQETMNSIASSRTWKVATTWWRIAGAWKKG